MEWGGCGGPGGVMVGLRWVNPLGAVFTFICDARPRQAIIWLIPFAAPRHNYGVPIGRYQCFDLCTPERGKTRGHFREVTRKISNYFNVGCVKQNVTIYIIA